MAQCTDCSRPRPLLQYFVNIPPPGRTTIAGRLQLLDAPPARTTRHSALTTFSRGTVNKHSGCRRNRGDAPPGRSWNRPGVNGDSAPMSKNFSSQRSSPAVSKTRLGAAGRGGPHDSGPLAATFLGRFRPFQLRPAPLARAVQWNSGEFSFAPLTATNVARPCAQTSGLRTQNPGPRTQDLGCSLSDQ
jgi:hypothetical protein